MVWDYAEANPFSGTAGDFSNTIPGIAAVLERLPCGGEIAGKATQASASSVDSRMCVISTDPPYYDNIGYSDLSDFFYVWLRRSLKDVHPSLFSTMLVPKAEELVANQYRHGGKDGARDFFEDGFRTVFANARRSVNPDYPMTVYYAFKQAETNAEGRTSTGIDAVAWAVQGAELGAGEILLNSMDADGVTQGFDTELIDAVRRQVQVPLIASGGAGSPQDFVTAANHGADGVLAASVFHYGVTTIPEAKNALRDAGHPVR